MRYSEFLEHAHNLYFKFAVKAGKRSRVATLEIAFNLLKDLPNPQIVELGTLRSFCTDPAGACRYDLNFWKPADSSYWDWGSGLFSLLAGISLPKAFIHTVDVTDDNINIAKTYTKPLADRFAYYTCGSSIFLRDYIGKIDLLYMDHSTDVEWPTQQLHLHDAKIVIEKDLIKKGGLILIDDYCVDDWQRCKLSLPYLLEHGFEVISSEYQILLQKT